MADDLSRAEEQRGWRRIFLWGIPIAFVIGILLLFVPFLGSHFFPNRVGQDQVASQKIDTTGATRAFEPAILQTKRDARFGEFLADDSGHALYVLKADKRGSGALQPESDCYEACAKSWPPLNTKGAPQAGSGLSAPLLGTFHRKDGVTQVTYNGWPLYRFVRDFGPEQGSGQNLSDYKGKWYLIAPSGEPLPTPYDDSKSQSGS